MDSSRPAPELDLSYLENLVTLGILINAYYYFGLSGAFIAFILAMILQPVSNADILEASSEVEE